MVGLGRFELPTRGLGDRGATVHPVRNNVFFKSPNLITSPRTPSHCRTSMTASPPHCLVIFTERRPSGMLMAHDTQAFKTSGGEARRRHVFRCPQHLRRRTDSALHRPSRGAACSARRRLLAVCAGG